MIDLRDDNRYLELMRTFPPRPPRSEEELLASQIVIKTLIAKEALTADEQDYLSVLALIVSDYEDRHYPIPDIHGVELLKALLKASDLHQKDLLPIFKTKSIVSEVLSGKRRLTVDHIQKLSEFFAISPAAFFKSTPPPSSSSKPCQSKAE